ncbi:MAG: sn-glycerol-1-phosphate dehydrogenase [Planctomycetaceae bacterium]|nr:sn-glycerol-1-phosphate dehydrogenase [Planctomycetaceae bacterium]
MNYAPSRTRIDTALRHADETLAVFPGENLLGQTPDFFGRLFNERKVVIVADENTYDAAGRAVDEHFRSAKEYAVEPPFLFREAEFHADADHLEQLRSVLAQTDAVPIAVGSGTINDLTKRAAFVCGRSYMVVATAASMDGYTAFGASIEDGGFKQTMNCPAPRAVLLDMDVLCRAPSEMSASGYADLLAKIPAGADWILADFVGTEPIDSVAWSTVQDSLRASLSEPEGIISGKKTAILALSEGLIQSGLAMQKAKSSRPASGAEHFFSHLWDNQHHTFQGRTPSHGFKVGIGSIATSQLYEKVLTLSQADFLAAKSRIPQFYLSWEAVEQLVATHFGTGQLAKQILEQSRQKHVGPEEIERRLDLFALHWKELSEKLEKQLLPSARIQEMLRQSGAAATSEEIGIDANRLYLSFEQARLIRCRYNVLDFVQETGNGNRMIPVPE